MTCSIDKFLTSRCREEPHILKEFISFLYEHNAYGKYVFNYAYTSDLWKDKYHDEGGDAVEFIRLAFRWAGTHEGDNYWSELHMEWVNKLHLLHHNNK